LELSKPLLANSDLQAIPALRELMVNSVYSESGGFISWKPVSTNQWEQPRDTGDG
jgi:hypothetical protein